MISTGGVVALTGRRRLGDAAEWVRLELARLITKLEPVRAVSGLAIGADTIWADTVLEAGVPLSAFVPFPQQASKWPADARNEWLRLFNAADDVRLFGTEYSPALFHARNEAMVDAADVVIAVWERSGGGGTGAAVRYARSQAKPIVHVSTNSRGTVLEPGVGPLRSVRP